VHKKLFGPIWNSRNFQVRVCKIKLKHTKLICSRQAENRLQMDAQQTLFQMDRLLFFPSWKLSFRKGLFTRIIFFLLFSKTANGRSIGIKEWPGIGKWTVMDSHRVCSFLIKAEKETVFILSGRIFQKK